jgi:hypothetical protein
VLSVESRWTNTLPRFGLSFLGAQWTESKLIGLVYAFEQITMVRDHVQPIIAPSTELKDVIKARGAGKVDLL